MNHAEVAQLAKRIVSEVERAIVGKREAVHVAVAAMLCEGHILIEDVPGVGKTTLAKALSRAVGGEFHRIQFTPDILPTDITGTSIYRQSTGEFEFRPGPLFSNIVLVDEVNRATPKTQSALLEAMEERQITSDGVTRPLPRPFFVLATQNNVEMTGTYPLPEAQLDRFFARVTIGYPDRAAEAEILRTQQLSHPVEALAQVCTLDEVVAAQDAVRRIHVSEGLREYIVDVIRATRTSGMVHLGSSPRGSLYLMHAAQALAAMDARDYATADDVKSAAPWVLGHRLMLRGEVRARGTDGASVVTQVMGSVAVPTATR
jgi:MoxR-like ATPase